MVMTTTVHILFRRYGRAPQSLCILVILPHQKSGVTTTGRWLMSPVGGAIATLVGGAIATLLAIGAVGAGAGAAVGLA